jgi:hypothetical protein
MDQRMHGSSDGLYRHGYRSSKVNPYPLRLHLVLGFWQSVDTGPGMCMGVKTLEGVQSLRIDEGSRGNAICLFAD